MEKKRHKTLYSLSFLHFPRFSIPSRQIFCLPLPLVAEYEEHEESLGTDV